MKMRKYVYPNPKDIQKNACIISCSLFHCKALRDIWLIVVQINEIIDSPDVILSFNYIKITSADTWKLLKILNCYEQPL